MTISELRKEAVRALGDGAAVEVCGPSQQHVGPLFVAKATDADEHAETSVYHRDRQTAMRALYAALREMGR